jgi:hypothetical protein
MSAFDVSPDRIRRIAIPAKAGIHPAAGSTPDEWVPAFAGMAALGEVTSKSFFLRVLNQ